MKRIFTVSIIAVLLSATNNLLAQRHVPLAIFVDINNSENSKIGGPISSECARALRSKSAIILADIHVIDVIASRVGLTETEKADIFLDATKKKIAYKMYALKNSPWLLFVPNDISIEGCFKRENLEDFSKSIPLETNKLYARLGYANLRKLIVNIKKNWKTTFALNDFDRLFATTSQRDLVMGRLVHDPNYPIWDIYWTGHGTRDDRLGGLSFKQEALPLLNFINKNLNVGVLYISTCYISGKIEQIAMQEGINKDIQQSLLNFVLILEGFLNQVTIASYEEEHINFKKFFDEAAHYGQGKTIEDVVLGFKGRYAGSMFYTVMQIWFPRAERPRVIEVDYHTRVITKVEAIAAAKNKTPIIVNVLRSHLKQHSEVTNVVIYPSAIATKLIVERTKVPNHSSEMPSVIFKNKNTPDAIALAQQIFPDVEKQLQNEDLKDERLQNIKNNFPKLYHLIEQYLNKNDDAFSLAKLSVDKSYPNFLIAHENPQWIEHVKLPKWDTYGGVFSFLSQSFLANAFTNKECVYLIDNLSGSNDISLLLELARFKVSQEALSPLEKTLAEHEFSSGEIVLENVIVETAYTLQLRQPAVIWIMFKLGNTAWSFEYDSARAVFKDPAHPGNWQIEQINVQEFLKQYEQYKAQAIGGVE